MLQAETIARFNQWHWRWKILKVGGKGGGTTGARGAVAPLMLWPYKHRLLIKVTTSYRRLLRVNSTKPFQLALLDRSNLLLQVTN